MIIVDYSATKKALARYDARKERLDALWAQVAALNAIHDVEEATRLVRRWETLMHANLDRLYQTFANDAWHLPPDVSSQFGIGTIRTLING